jgi:hypothetical protein
MLNKRFFLDDGTRHPTRFRRDVAIFGVIARETPLLEFRRRRAVEHIALRSLQQNERIGLDRERTAHAF